jgi:hypothetical protein
MNAQLKDSLIATGDEAFLALTQQIQHMLDLIDFYMQRYQPTGSAKHDGLAFKHEQLKEMINTLGTLPYQLADVIRRWKHNEPRVLSRLGVELELLNEIWATLEVTMLFFIQHDMDLEPYNRSKAEKAFRELVRVNNCIL